MAPDAYRLWQQWQQMHYPRRGLPVEEAERLHLVSLDGTAGPILERHFQRRSAPSELDGAALEALERCRRNLHSVAALLSSDASRYFGRLLLLIEVVLPTESDGTAGARDHRYGP